MGAYYGDPFGERAKHPPDRTARGREFAPRTAWDLIGWDDGLIRAKGGRAVYEAVMFYDNTPGDKVKLARLKRSGDLRIRQISRYVDPDTELEPADEQARENWEKVNR